jgi:hypothetical protein
MTIIYGQNCSPTLVGVSGSKNRFKKYKANIVSLLTNAMKNWTGTKDSYLPDILNCGLSIVKGNRNQYLEVFEVTKDAHQSQTIRNLKYTHFQLEATSTKGWLNSLRIHVYTSSAKGGHTIITYDYGGWRYIYEDDSKKPLQTQRLTFNMEYLT